MDYRISPEELIDITMSLSDRTPVWPGDNRFRKQTSIACGFRTSKLIMSTHSGTHIDAPGHLARYSTFVDDIPLNRLITPAVVADCTGEYEIARESIENLSLEGKALLLKTIANPGDLSDNLEYSHLTSEAAELAVNMGVRTVGIDTLSVDSPDSTSVHEILLKNSVPILENLILEGIHPGDYLLICLPLKIDSADGCPVRAFLQRC